MYGNDFRTWKAQFFRSTISSSTSACSRRTALPPLEVALRLQARKSSDPSTEPRRLRRHQALTNSPVPVRAELLSVMLIRAMRRIKSHRLRKKAQWRTSRYLQPYLQKSSCGFQSEFAYGKVTFLTLIFNALSAETPKHGE